MIGDIANLLGAIIQSTANKIETKADCNSTGGLNRFSISYFEVIVLLLDCEYKKGIYCGVKLLLADLGLRLVLQWVELLP